MFGDTCKANITRREANKHEKSKAKPCRILFYFSLLLITSKATKVSLVKSEEVKVKVPKTCAFGTLEQVAGIEPVQSAWEAEILPLNYTCKV